MVRVLESKVAEPWQMRTDIACVEAVKTAVAKGGEADRQRARTPAERYRKAGTCGEQASLGSQRQIEFPKKLWKTA